MSPPRKQIVHDCDWPEHKLLVVDKLKGIGETLQKVDGRLDSILTNQATLAQSQATSQASTSGEVAYKKWLWPVLFAVVFGVPSFISSIVSIIKIIKGIS